MNFFYIPAVGQGYSWVEAHGEDRISVVFCGVVFVLMERECRKRVLAIPAKDTKDDRQKPIVPSASAGAGYRSDRILYRPNRCSTALDISINHHLHIK